MPEPRAIVINTGPLLALIAAMGDLGILKLLYERVVVPFEVCEEILAGCPSGFGVGKFQEDDFITRLDNPAIIQPYLRNSLDL